MENFWNFKISDAVQLITTLVMIWAVIKAPAWAVNAQWKLQLKADERERKLHLFKTLMATRANPVHESHVESLNLIDVEFHTDSVEDRGIRLAWKEYLDQLIQNAKDAEAGKNDRAQTDAREERRQNLLAQLLFKMGGALGYKFEGFDFLYLKERSYIPQGHIDLSTEQRQIRKGLVEMLWRGRPLMVRDSPLSKTIEPSPPETLATPQEISKKAEAGKS